MAEIDWGEAATLYLQLPLVDGTKTFRAAQFGPLRWIIDLALSGQYGPSSVLLIETESGLVIESEMLEEIARLRPQQKS